MSKSGKKNTNLPCPRSSIIINSGLQAGQFLAGPGAEADLRRCVDRPEAVGEAEVVAAGPQGPRAGTDRLALYCCVSF